MNYSNSYFKLFTNCIPVYGSQNSLIYDFQRHSFYEITNQLFELLPHIEHYTLEEIKRNSESVYEAIMDLNKNELGFITESPELFPKLSSNWDIPQFISNVILEFKNEMPFDFHQLIKEIKSLHCHTIVIVFLENPSNLALSKLLEVLKNNEFYYAELWFLCKPTWLTIIKTIVFFNFISSILIFNSKRRIKKIRNTFIKYYEYSSHLDFCKNEPCPIFLDYMFYCESQEFNNCLNRKLAINQNGDIKNCLHLNNSYGNFKNSNILKVINSKEFQELWHISKNKIKICNCCEYRFACLDCRAFVEDISDPLSKPKLCIKSL